MLHVIATNTIFSHLSPDLLWNKENANTHKTDIIFVTAVLRVCLNICTIME